MKSTKWRLDMKLELKSFAIGVLLTVNVLLLLGLNSNDEDSQIGRYQALHMPSSLNTHIAYVMDTSDGTFVKYLFENKVSKEVDRNPNRLDGSQGKPKKPKNK